MNILCIDYGDRYVGFAFASRELKVALPLEAVKVKSMKEAISESEKMIKSRNAELVVIGLPLLTDGSEGERASKTRAFGKVLGRITGVEIKFQDERYTTLEAKEYLAEGNVKPKDMKKYTDKLAASIILESYLKEN